jgi:ribonuclease-3
MRRRKQPVPQSSAPPADAHSLEDLGTEKSTPAARPKRKRRARSVSVVEDRIGYRFADKALLECALTHVSALASRPNRSGNYQRLEFLGDHVLGLAVSDLLFKKFPRASEGELSKRLADLVRRETCASVARSLDLGASLRLGASEAQAAGRERTAILADVCEALVGAVYLDAGYARALQLVEALWGERMSTKQPVRDPKTALQEWAQGRGLPTPSYKEVGRTWPQHGPEFRVAVALPGRVPTEGVGPSKRAAEQAAAAAMLEREGVDSGSQ